LPKNITLLTLPSNSPELNPAKIGWHYLRQNKLCALVCNSNEAIVDSCKNAWNWLIDEPARIRSIGSRDWAVC
jgi:transposase